MLSSARTDEPAVARAVFVGTVVGLGELGVDREALLARLGVEVRELAALPERIPSSAMYGLWQALTELTGERGYGIRLAGRVQPDTFSVFGGVVATSATLGDALTRAVRLLRLLHETVRFSVHFNADLAVVALELLDRNTFHAEAAEFLLGGIVSLGRQLTGSTRGPFEVRFAHERPAHAGMAEAFFACPVRYASCDNSIAFDPAVLSLPVLGHDPDRCAALQREADTLLAGASEPGAFRREVMDMIGREIGDGDPTIKRVAARIGLHPKTLSRRLRADGTSYRQLLDEVRFHLARRCLDEPGLSVAEIAFRLAYSEKSAFNRAFKRWAGKPPEAYRRG